MQSFVLFFFFFMQVLMILEFKLFFVFRLFVGKTFNMAASFWASFQCQSVSVSVSVSNF